MQDYEVLLVQRSDLPAVYARRDSGCVEQFRQLPFTESLLPMRVLLGTASI